MVYRLRRHWKDGTSAVVFAPLDFIARPVALVPRPRVHLLISLRPVAARQRQRLAREGVRVPAMGRIDLARFRWLPRDD